MKLERRIEEKVHQIKALANRNDDMIWYDRMLDILCDKEESVSEEVIAAVLHRLEAEGISIEYKTDEDYDASTPDLEGFIPANVNISQRPMNIYNLMERLENDEINMAPEFQRNSNLWSEDQQSRLIESLMLKIPIPTFYFNAADEDKWIVIDGLQRLSAFNNYLVGMKDENNERVKRKFSGLQYMTEFNGMTFDDLPRQYIRRIKETPIVAYTVEKGTPDGIVYNIFQRINTGLIKLEPQEIRQALYIGNATRLIKKLSESESFLQATQHAIPTTRMQDKEYVNRFIAFTELDYKTAYKGNIDDFLRKALKVVNRYDKNELKRIERSFNRTMKYCGKIFGKYAFRKYNQDKRRGPINKALFETWGLIVSELSDDELAQLVDERECLIIKFGSLLHNPDYLSALKAGDQYSVKRRIEMTREVIKEIVW